MFLQKVTSHCKNSLMLGLQGPKQYIFGYYFYLNNARKFRFYVFLLFHVRKHMISSFYLKCIEFTRNCEFCSNCGSPGIKWYHMFSSIKIEECMEPELSGIFRDKMVKNIVLGSPGTHFMHMRVKAILRYFHWVIFKQMDIISQMQNIMFVENYYM